MNAERLFQDFARLTRIYFESRGVDGDTLTTAQSGPTAHRDAAVNIGCEAGSEPADSQLDRNIVWDDGDPPASGDGSAGR